MRHNLTQSKNTNRELPQTNHYPTGWLTDSHWPCIIIAILVFLGSSLVIGLFIPGILLLPALGSFWHWVW